jgi:hypothetical protein
LLMVAGEHRRPPTVPTPTGRARTDHTARHDLVRRRSSLIVTDGRRLAPISIAATSEHTWKTVALLTGDGSGMGRWAMTGGRRAGVPVPAAPRQSRRPPIYHSRVSDSPARRLWTIKLMWAAVEIWTRNCARRCSPT